MTPFPARMVRRTLWASVWNPYGGRRLGLTEILICFQARLMLTVNNRPTLPYFFKGVTLPAIWRHVKKNL